MPVKDNHNSGERIFADDMNAMASLLNFIEANVAKTLTVPSGFDANSVDSDLVHGIWSGSQAVNLPADPGIGILITRVIIYAGSRPKSQTYIRTDGTPGIWVRYSGSVGWAAWRRIDGGSTVAESGFDANNVPNVDTTYSFSGATNGVNLPEVPHGAGYLTTTVISYAGHVPKAQTFQRTDSTPQLWTRFSGSVGWSAWKRIDAGAVVIPDQKEAIPPGGKSLRSVPLILSTGGGRSVVTTQGAVRVPMRFGATIPRWRLHIANVNPRFGIFSPDIHITAPHIGLANGTSGGASNLVSLGPSELISATTSDGLGSEYVTPWQTTPIEANTDYMISYGHMTPGAEREECVAGGWVSSDPADARSTTGTWTKASRVPLFAWIEAEVPSSVPTLGVLGDSLSCGVGSSVPVYDSWLSQYCRPRGILPVHYASSGDTMDGWSDPSHYKWARWDDMDSVDAVIHALGTNDVFGGASLADLKTRNDATRDILKSKVSTRVYAATILPRTSVTGSMETVRKDYNNWLKTSSYVDTYLFPPKISSDDETILPAYDHDGIHLNTAGYFELTKAISRPPVNLNKTPWYTTSSGMRYCRIDDTVFVNMYGPIPESLGTGNVDVGVLPEGFRPVDNHEGGIFFLGTTVARVHLMTYGPVRLYGITSAGMFITMSACFRTTQPFPVL